MDCSPPGYSEHGDPPGKNTGVGCYALLQGMFQTQGLNLHLLCLLHGRQIFFYPLSHREALITDASYPKHDFSSLLYFTFC